MIKQGLTLLFKSTNNYRQMLKTFNKLNTNKAFIKVNGFKFSTSTQNQQETKSQKLKNQKPSEQNNKKLSELEFDQLIQMKTQQSLSVAESKLQQVQKKVAQNHKKLTQMAQQMQFFQKHAQQIKQKQLKLVQNIEQQQTQLKRVKVRADRQVEDSKKYGITKIAKQLLEAADCINRCKNQAVKQYPNSNDPYVQGIIETQKKLHTILKNFDIEEFDPTGKQYDPNTQESLLEIPCMPGYNAGTVATTMRTGYLIQGRLLRSARVGIFSK